MAGSNRAVPYLMLVGSAVIYGSIFSLNKIAAEAGLPPIGYAFWQSFVAGLALLIVTFVRRAPPGLGIAHLRAYVVIGALVFGLPVALLTYVAPNLPAGIMTLVLALSPPLTYLFGMLARIERFYWFGALGIALGFGGVLVLIGPSAALPNAGMVGWFLLSLAAPVMFAGANVLASVLRPPALGSVAMGAGVLLGSSAVLVVTFVQRAPPGLGIVHLRAYVVIGALVFGLPVALLTYVAPHLPAGIMTLVLALSPPLTYLFGMAARIERFYRTGALGILLGFGGVLVLIGPTAALPNAAMVGWFALSLVAPVMFAGANVLAAVLRPPAAGSVAMGAGVLLGSSAVLVIIMAITGQTYWFADFPTAGDWAVLAAAAVNAAFVVLFLEIVRRAGPVFFAQFNYLAVLAGIAWGWVIFSETLNALVWVAFALMVAGVVLTSYKPATAKPDTA